MTRKPVIRTCVVCREQDQKRQLTRLIRTEDGVIIDSTGKLNGRGAYLCDKPECWVRAASSDILSKALRVTLTEADRERIRQAASVS
jgi:predicted RNA-binding protein YlxR (DUF448 family)